MSTGVVCGSHGSIVADDWRRVTIADAGGGAAYGYSTQSGTYGAINNASYKTATIVRVNTFQGSPNHTVFVYMSPGNLAQNFFERVYLRKTDGTWIAFNTSDTVVGSTYFADAGGFTWWQWATPIDSAWKVSDNTLIRQVKFV